MNSFLFPGDYPKHIQFESWRQVTNSLDPKIIDSIQSAAIEECKSYLKQKYDVSSQFKPTLKHVEANTYNAGDVVYLDADEYNNTKTYALGSFVAFQDKIYKCSTAITVAEPFDEAKWTLLGDRYEVFTAKYPSEIFDYKKYYRVGDEVFWENKKYTCARSSQLLDHQALLNINSAGSDVVVNVFPNDPSQGAIYWGIGTSYAVPQNTVITNTTYWENADGRDQKLVEVCVNIAIYRAHARISPKNIPDIRIISYMGDPNDREVRDKRVLYPTYSALGWLQAAAIGDDITPNMPLLQPLQGKRIRFGGNQKQVNTY